MIEWIKNSKYFSEVKDFDKIKFIRENFYKDSPQFKQSTLDNIYKVLFKNNVKITDIYNYYFFREACNTKVFDAKTSVNKAIKDDLFIQYTINTCFSKPKLFLKKTLIESFKNALKIASPSHIAKIPPNFPLKECIRVLKNYTLAPSKRYTYIDPCCGWGVRMLASAVLDIDYVGFDVNKRLIKKLREFGDDIRKFKPNWNYTIFEHGSQYLESDLINTADIIFTSPPYFNLERYGNNELEKEDSLGGSYQDWLDLFYEPLFKNLFQYIKNDKLVLINIKNFKKYTLEEDTIRLGEKAGLKFLETDTLINIKRLTNKGKTLDNSEKIFIFKKC